MYFVQLNTTLLAVAIIAGGMTSNANGSIACSSPGIAKAAVANSTGAVPPKKLATGAPITQQVDETNRQHDANRNRSPQNAAAGRPAQSGVRFILSDQVGANQSNKSIESNRRPSTHQQPSGEETNLSSPSNPSLSSEDSEEESAADEASTDDRGDNGGNAETKTQGRETLGPTWPESPLMIDKLRDLAEYEVTYQWSADTLTLLNQLWQTPLDDPERAAQLIQDLDGALVQLRQLMGSIPSNYMNSTGWQELYAKMSRVNYALHRRQRVWKQTALLMQDPPESNVTTNSSAVVNATLASAKTLERIGPNSSWRDYLMLDKIEKVFTDSRFKQVHRQAVSRKVLARATSPSLSAEQYQFIEDVLGEQYMEQLQDAATEPIDFERLLKRLEAYEANPAGADHYYFNSEYRNAYFSRDPETRGLADVIDSLYRNANIRIAVSDDLINRALPSQPEMREPVADRILGAQVFGNNRIRNQLQVRLVPDDQRLNLQLLTLGSVFSRTRAHHQSGFIFHNLGNSRYRAVSDIVIGKQGITANSADVDAYTQQKLVGVRSNLDNIPILGFVARQIAENQQRSSAPLANQVVEDKLKRLARSRLDREVGTRLANLQTAFDRKFIAPLKALELEPTPVELRTTEDDLLVRYRLAGRDQMSAHTARPQAKPGNLMNVQIHDSVINNLLNKIEINGHRFTTDEFADHLRALLGNPDLFKSERLEDARDASFMFAARDGIHVHFGEGGVKVTLNLRQLRLGDSREWRHFSVSALYIPQFEGMRIQFVLDEERGIRLDGHGLTIGDEIALRTIFNSLYPEIYSLPSIHEMVPEHIPTRELELSQLVFSHGWLGLSLAEREQMPNRRAILHVRPRIFR